MYCVACDIVQSFNDSGVIVKLLDKILRAELKMYHNLVDVRHSTCTYE